MYIKNIFLTLRGGNNTENLLAYIVEGMAKKISKVLEKDEKIIILSLDDDVGKIVSNSTLKNLKKFKPEIIFVSANQLNLVFPDNPEALHIINLEKLALKHKATYIWLLSRMSDAVVYNVLFSNISDETVKKMSQGEVLNFNPSNNTLTRVDI